jgi:integrase/recombinase XerD
MAQARSLDEQELARVLAQIEHSRQAHRNRAMRLLTHWAGLRVGEVAVLRWSDVTNSDGQIKDEYGYYLI